MARHSASRIDAVLTVLFAFVFRTFRRASEVREVRLGAAVTAVLFVIGKFALALPRQAAVCSAFGAAIDRRRALWS